MFWYLEENYLNQNSFKKRKITLIWLSEQMSRNYIMVNAYAQNRKQPSLEDLYQVAEILLILYQTNSNEKVDEINRNTT